jgi:hypothetical protein
MKLKKCITLEDEVIKKTEQQAKIEGRNFSNMVERMIRKYLPLETTTNTKSIKYKM